MALVGSFWLKEGVNTLGSSPDCEIHLPKQAPNLLGAIKLDRGAATLQVDLGQSVDVNGAPAGAATPLRWDDTASPTIITFKDLRMVMIQEAGRIGVRLWDKGQVRAVARRTWFEVDETYRIRAQYTAYPVPVKVGLPNVRGESETGYVQGYLSLKLGGKSHNVDAAELRGGRLYVQFGDLTNGVRTYPSGRYLITEPVLEDGDVVVDFNKAYNPPCAFRATEACTFAPSQNRIRTAVEAGELYEQKR